MNSKALFRPALYILWGVVLVWGVVFVNNIHYAALLTQLSYNNSYINDMLSDAALLFVAFMPILWTPRFFGYQPGTVSKHWKMLLGMVAFFVSTPLAYRLIIGGTPFGANTWFFEGIVVPFAEEGFFRGILLSMLLWGFGQMYSMKTANGLTI